ncbi:hypothetical protein M2341_001073 [Sphingobium sp. B7D2B]|uniref:transferrin-binding protein-like solute binding protein n=1 Tax=Sphingobium sp. B7D2B TaxID=2940583 RepID=UPI0022256BB0|nr:transferrin-binding protein-like solute binding protein [Sphingobium sp. B7D2B]MCW2365626.1 hypothetical protein [Sphingobium sp. B7D2B]
MPPIAGQNSSGHFAITAGDSKILSYDAPSKSFKIEAAYGSAPYPAVTFNVEHIVTGESNYTTYQRAEGSGPGQISRLALSLPGDENGKIQLYHSGYGSFGANSLGPLTPWYFTFGQTPTSTPLSGTATYSGLVEGCSVACGNRISGTSTLNLNFQSATLSTELHLLFSTEAGFTQLTPIRLSGLGNLDIWNGSAIEGSVRSTDGSVRGRINGGFYGLNNEEFGFQFNTYQPNGLYNLQGITIGTRNGQAPAPDDQRLDAAVQRGEVFDGPSAHIALRHDGSRDAGLYASLQNRIRYDPATDRYTLTREFFSGIVEFGAPEQRGVLNNLAIYEVAEPLDPANVAKNVAIELFKIGSANSAINLTYLTYGFLAYTEINDAQIINNYRTFLYGVGTPTSAIPTTGSASFTGIVDGIYTDMNGRYRISGTSALVANFVDRTLTTSLTFTGSNTVDGGPILASQTFNGEGAFKNHQNPLSVQYEGLLSNSTDAAIRGQFAGKFFGPLAEEYGYSFTINNPTIVAAGVALGKR